MPQFRKKPVVIEADQWFKNGDHPHDASEWFLVKDGEQVLTEGNVVGFFYRRDVPETRACEHCGETMGVHGWISTLEGGHIVCPGDWVITGVEFERYPCKPSVFEKTYEPV